MPTGRSIRRWFAPLVGALLLAVGPVAAAHVAPGTGDGAVLRGWLPKYMDRSGGVTRAEAVEEARHFDIIIAKSGTYPSHVTAMRAANPSMALLAYLNATFAPSGAGDAYPSSWYVRDATGEKVRSTRWGNYMMDPTMRGWIDNRASLCAKLKRSSGYDGCGLDVLGTTPVTNPTYVTGTPVNAATGKAWTPQEWLAATTRLADSVRARVAPAPVIGNGIGDGPRYFDASFPSGQLLDGLDGGMAEGFLRNGRAPITELPTKDAWKANVDMLLDAGSRGVRLVVVTKTWTSATDAQKDAWHKFALASFLLGTDGRSRFIFLYEESGDPGAWHPWWDTDLGEPSAAYAARGDGTYDRPFTRGRAIANPTEGTRAVPLGGTYTTLDGRRVTSLTLPPHSGEVLMR